MMKVKGESSGQTSNNQTVDKKVSISERSAKRTTSKYKYKFLRLKMSIDAQFKESTKVNKMKFF